MSSLWGWPRAQGSNELVFQLFVPAGDKPAAGWPVAIFGHGFTDSMYGAPWTVASVMASSGIATLAINVVGHGGGAAGSLQVTPVAGLPVTIPAGGRGIDQDGNGAIDSTEGVNAAPPRESIGSRDGLRQTVVDLMQLVRQVEVGMDVDGDGRADLDAGRIYYAGQSFGGIYGTILLGVEPNIQAGVPNVAGGSITEVARLGAFRFLTAAALATRQPQLLNLPPTPGVPVPFNLNFNENMPLRDLPPVVNTVPGALAIAEVLDRFEWVQQSGNPVSYAPLIRKQPPWGHARKPVIVQFAKGDSTVPNPSSSALVRAGGLEDRTTYFRNDLAVAANAAVPKNPHTFLTNIGGAATGGLCGAGADADRRVLQEQRRADHRPRRPGRVLRGADQPASARRAELPALNGRHFSQKSAARPRFFSGERDGQSLPTARLQVEGVRPLGQHAQIQRAHRAHPDRAVAVVDQVLPGERVDEHHQAAHGAAPARAPRRRTAPP